MVDFDPQNDTVPKNSLVVKTFPTIAALKAALNTYNATSYTAARMMSMTENDLIYACKLHSLTVVGL